MGSPRHHSSKLVYPASVYQQLTGIPDSWDTIFKDGNYSVIAFGQSGSGKDTICSYAINNDLAHNQNSHNPRCKNGISLFSLLPTGCHPKKYPRKKRTRRKRI